MISIGSNHHTLNLEHCYIANLIGITNDPVGKLKSFEETNQISETGALWGLPARKRRSLLESSAALESESIVTALRESQGNIAAAAGDLSISRQLLNYKIGKHGLRSLLNELRNAEKN